MKAGHKRNGRLARLRWQSEASLSRTWIKENLPKVWPQIVAEAARRYPRPKSKGDTA